MSRKVVRPAAHEPKLQAAQGLPLLAAPAEKPPVHGLALGLVRPVLERLLEAPVRDRLDQKAAATGQLAHATRVAHDQRVALDLHNAVHDKREDRGRGILPGLDAQVGQHAHLRGGEAAELAAVVLDVAGGGEGRLAPGARHHERAGAPPYKEEREPIYDCVRHGEKGEYEEAAGRSEHVGGHPGVCPQLRKRASHLDRRYHPRVKARSAPRLVTTRAKEPRPLACHARLPSTVIVSPTTASRGCPTGRKVFWHRRGAPLAPAAFSSLSPAASYGQAGLSSI